MKQYFLSLMQALGSFTERCAGTGLDDYVKKLDAKLVAAGDPLHVHGRELLGIQVVSAVVFSVLWGSILAHISWFDFLFNGPHQVLVFLALILFGFYFPCMNVNDRITLRHKSIALELPDVVDLLTVCVEAGLDFVGALRTVVEKQKKGPLKDELERFLKQLELGRTRSEALREMSHRVGLSDLSSVASSMIQAARLGSPIGPVLRIQSDMLRTRRGQRAEKAAMEATVKMLAPLMLCIFPAVFIMILAPVIIQMMANVK